MQFQAQVVLLAFRGSPDPAALLKIEAESVNAALNLVFQKANTIDQPWIDNDEVIEFYGPNLSKADKPEGMRSLSVGDHIILIGHGRWEVKPFGFEVVS